MRFKEIHILLFEGLRGSTFFRAFKGFLSFSLKAFVKGVISLFKTFVKGALSV